MFSSNLYCKFATLWFVTVKIYVFRIGWRSSPHIWLLYMVTIFQLKYGETNVLFCLQKYTKQKYIHAWLKLEKRVMGSCPARRQVKVCHLIINASFVSWVCCCTHPKVMTGNGQLTKVHIIKWRLEKSIL